MKAIRISKSVIFLFSVLLIISFSFIFNSVAYSLSEKEPSDFFNNISNEELAEGDYYISTSYNINKVVDVTGGCIADGTNIEIWTRNIYDNQKFHISYDAEGYATIKNRNGKVLDVAGSSAKSGTNVVQWADKGSLNQKWVISKSGDYFRICSALKTANGKELCLDVYGCSQQDGANIQVYEDNGGANQFFSLTKIDSNKISGEKIINDGFYYIKMSSNLNMCVDIPGNSLSDCTKLNLWNYNGGENQLFYFKWDESTRCYTIKSVLSSKMLDAEGKNPFPLTRVIQYSDTGEDNQKWALTKRTDDSVLLRNRFTALALDIYGGYSSAGTAIDTYPSNDNKSQKFTLVKGEIVSEGLNYLLSKVADNRYIDIPQFSWDEGMQLETYSGNTAYNQKFFFKEINADIYTIRSLASGLLVGAISNKVIQTNINNEYSKWKVEWDDGGIVLQNVGSKLYMTVENSSSSLGSKIVLTSKNNARGQYFCCKKTDFSSDMTYTISTECAIENSLNINANSWKQCASIIMWNSLSDNNSKWMIRSAGNDYYKISSSMTEYVLDVNNHGTHDGDIVQQYSWNAGKNQLWKVEFTDDGWFQFVSVETGRLLTNLDKSSKKSAKVGVYHQVGDSSQRWKFRSTTSASFSGNSELDAHLRNICRACPDLRSVYNCVAGYPYRDGDKWPSGNWTIPYALEMIYCRSGNCYRYAALFMWCARALGYDCNAHCGELGTKGGGRQPHGWVEVYSGGVFVCDPELQHVLGQYNFYMITYATAPVIYYP